MLTRRIYLLSPKKLSPETIAVAFAKTSRSPESFDEIAAGLSEEASTKFHEKWVVGYGHASVAEHAILHIAFENVSRLAVECIESNRLASYTEKSTRYQKWDADLYHVPVELDCHPLQGEYIRTCKLLFATYAQSLQPVRAVVEGQNPRKENESEEAYDRRIRSQYVDSCRFLLPAASLANLGMTANARVLEHSIRKMLSHPLAEVRQIGEQVKRVAQAEVPTLVKYADKVPYLVDTASALAEQGQTSTNKPDPNWCKLVNYDEAGENRILAAALYRYSGASFTEAFERVKAASSQERLLLAEATLGRLGPHDIPLRELEYTTYTFDLIFDQGGYAEFKRHRMMTQTPQELTPRLGYATPRRVSEAGFEASYCAAMDAAADLYEKMAGWNSHVASYIVPNGFNRRVLCTMNLREAFSFCQLRTAPNAHFSMRRVANAIAGEIRRVHPLLAKYMQLSREDWQEIETRSFTSA